MGGIYIYLFSSLFFYLVSDDAYVVAKAENAKGTSGTNSKTKKITRTRSSSGDCSEFVGWLPRTCGRAVESRIYICNLHIIYILILLKSVFHEFVAGHLNLEKLMTALENTDAGRR